MSRPEHQAPPEIFYNEAEAAKYSSNSHIIDVQTRMTERALELLLLPEGEECLLLDAGCGSGLSGERLSELGHSWIGLDISPSMLEVARSREIDGDVILSDLGSPFRFRPGVFDGAISISAIQWLCNADKKEHEPYRRLLTFFKWLFAVLKPGARAALQFYPENAEQLEMITSASLRSGFGGGLVIDFPHSTKAKKHFLVIWAGFNGAASPQLPQGLVDDTQHVTVTGRIKTPRTNKRPAVKDRSWVINKKEMQRKLGKDIRPDTKYTARKRRDKF